MKSKRHRHSRRTRQHVARACACEALEGRLLLAAAAIEQFSQTPRSLPGGTISLAQSMQDQPAATGAASMYPLSSVRPRVSLPGAPVTVYLDFDGEAAFEWDPGNNPTAVHGPGGDDVPVPAFSIDNSLLDYTNDELDGMDAIWAQTAEKFSPFNINVTTVRPASFNDAEAVHMIIGGSVNDWYQKPAGGVAAFEGFTRSERSNEGFVWSADAITAGSTTLSAGNRHFIAESIAHEAGHLFGLQHQSVVNGNTVTVEYSNGDSVSAPIMGASSNNNAKRGVWWNGLTSKRDNNNVLPTGPQDDLAVLTRPGTNITYQVDDFGSATSGAADLGTIGATGAVAQSGVIERVGDQDAFKFVAAGPIFTFTVDQFRFNGMLLPGTPGMLAPMLELIAVSGTAPMITLSATATSVTLSTGNATPGQAFVLRVSPLNNAYGNLGQYTITGNVGTFAHMTGNTVFVDGYSTDNDIFLGYDAGTNEITVQDHLAAGSVLQRFPRGSVTGVVVNCLGGNDVVSVLGAYSSLNVPTTVNGAGGSDTLVLQGTAGNDYQALTANGGFVDNNTTGRYTGMENATLTAFDGADTFEVYETAAGFGTTLLGGNQDDVFNVGASPFASTTVGGAVSISGNPGNDTLNLGNNNADSVDADVTFSGDAHSGPVGDRIVINDFAPSYNVSYDIAPTFIVRDGINLAHTITFAGTEGIVINAGSGADTVKVRNGVAPALTANGNNGNDNFIVGGGNLTGFLPQDVVGGNGTDTLTYDDSANPSGKTWDVNQTFHPQEIIYSGLISLFTTGFESVAILAGLGGDTITFANDVTQNYSVNGGNGAANSIHWNAADNWFRNPDGADARLAVNLVCGPAGAGNLLIFEDLARDDTDYYVADTEVSGIDSNSSLDGFDVNYYNADVFTINASNGANTFEFVSAIPKIGTYNFFGRGGPDSFNIFLDPASRVTLRTDGNDGADALNFNDSAFPGAATYTIGTDTISRASAGGVFGAFSFNTVESMFVAGTAGNDTFAVNQYGSGIPLVVNGGLGNDTLNFGGDNLPVNINVSTFSFDGQGGFDRFNLNNAAYVGNFTYTRNVGSIAASGVTLNDANIEEMTVNAGPGGDLFAVRALAVGTSTIFNANGGSDSLVLADLAQDLAAIQGHVTYNAGAGGGNMYVYDNADTTGDTAHLTASTLGAYANDTLFGPGGSLSFTGVTTIGSFPGLTLNLGSGADAIYAQPLANAKVTINAANPLLPGDQLNLALAGAQGATVNGTPSSGNVTSTNLQTLNWTGFEIGPASDAIAPAFVAANINLDGIPGIPGINVLGDAPGLASRQSLDVQFSENVSGLLSATWLELTNLTTNSTIPTGSIDVEYDAGTNTAHFTFLGYPNGMLPDGNYHGRILAGLPDFFGNALAADAEFNFFFLTADANHDARVDTIDFNILAASFGNSGRTFSQGNFDYDPAGNVDTVDFNLLASNFGKALAPGAAAASVALSGAAPAAGMFSQTMVVRDKDELLTDLIN